MNFRFRSISLCHLLIYEGTLVLKRADHCSYIVFLIQKTRAWILLVAGSFAAEFIAFCLFHLFIVELETEK